MGAAIVIIAASLMAAKKFAPHINGEGMSGMELKVAWPNTEPIEKYEPTRIHLAPQYILLENLYGTLVNLDVEGEVTSGIAEQYEWVGNELHFQIRKDLKTADGMLITPEDVIFSLKRLLVIAENTHGNLKSILCLHQTLTSVDSPCEGIEVSGDTVILKPVKKDPFLLPMVAAIDFAIIPRSSVDPKTLAIKDYRNTSGVYYVESDQGNGYTTLAVNPFHFDYSDKIPQKIQLIPTQKNETAVDQFRRGEVNYIMTVDPVPHEEVYYYSKDNRDAEFHATLPIRNYILVFSQKGQKRIPKVERLALGKKIQAAFRKNFEGMGLYEPSNEFFPSFGNGGLSDEQLREVEGQIAKSNESVLNGKKYRVSLVRIGSIEKYRFLEKEVPNLQVEVGANVIDFAEYKNPDDMPDMMLVGPDTGFQEDIGLVTYSMNAGFFGLERGARKEWLKRYMAIDSKEERLKNLRSLHYQSLSEPVLVPLVMGPYVALVKKPWKIKLSKFYANNPFTLIERE